MDVVFNSLLIFVLLVVNVSMKNFHLPHSYLHSLAMPHGDSQHYDSYSSEGVVLRAHRQHNRHSSSDCSDSDHHYRCKCSCPKCNKPKKCCIDFCAKHCPMTSNILVVPYPVPFVVNSMNNGTGGKVGSVLRMDLSTQDAPNTTQETTTTKTTTTTPSTTTSTTTTTTEQTKKLSIATTPFTRKTMEPNSYKIINENYGNYYSKGSGYKRYRILNDKKGRRSYPSNQLPANFDDLPKYGIVPIPENLAMSLMHQIRSDQRNEQLLRRRQAVNKRGFNYGRS